MRRSRRITNAIEHGAAKYGLPPFGTLLSANANPSTLENWGDNSWVTLHQIGNMREHNNYWYLTEIFRAPHPQAGPQRRTLLLRLQRSRAGRGNGYQYGAPGGTDEGRPVRALRHVRQFPFGRHSPATYTARKASGAPISNPPRRSKCGTRSNGIPPPQMRYLRTFALSIGKRYQDLVPNADLVSTAPDCHVVLTKAWAYCARTPDRNIFLAYFEKRPPARRSAGPTLQRLSRPVVRPAQGRVDRRGNRNPGAQRHRSGYHSRLSGR